MKRTFVQITWLDHFDCNKLETLLLESLDDLTDKTTLDTVGLDGDESALGALGGDGVGRGVTGLGLGRLHQGDTGASQHKGGDGTGQGASEQTREHAEKAKKLSLSS